MVVRRLVEAFNGQLWQEPGLTGERILNELTVIAQSEFLPHLYGQLTQSQDLTALVKSHAEYMVTRYPVTGGIAPLARLDLLSQIHNRRNTSLFDCRLPTAITAVTLAVSQLFETTGLINLSTYTMGHPGAVFNGERDLLYVEYGLIGQKYAVKEVGEVGIDDIHELTPMGIEIFEAEIAC